MIGQRLKEGIKAKGLTNGQVAEIAGISESYLSQIIGGIKRPKIEMRRRLAKAIGVNVEYFDMETSRPQGVLVMAYIDAREGIVSEATTQYEAGAGIYNIPLPPGYTQEQVDTEGIIAYEIRGDQLRPTFRNAWKIYAKPVALSDICIGDLLVIEDVGTRHVVELDIITDNAYIFRSLHKNRTPIIRDKTDNATIEMIVGTWHI